MAKPLQVFYVRLYGRDLKTPLAELVKQGKISDSNEWVQEAMIEKAEREGLIKGVE